MVEALSGMVCFVTISVSMIYGTRIAWGCGIKCNFKEEPENKKQALYESIPAATLIYFFGFLVVFNLCISGPISILVTSLTSAILLSGTIVTMAMPELKRKPTTK